MSPKPAPEKRRLDVVEEAQELRGAGPADFERLARTCTAGSNSHRGVLAVATTLSQRAVGICVPPSARVELLAGLEVARLWIAGKATPQDAQGARAKCFQAAGAVERMTARAVAEAQTHLEKAQASALDAHADHVVIRYARLAAHFTVSSVCHCLDTISEPQRAVDVLQDAEGARAYQLTGLGSARHAAFREAAYRQASWEAARDSNDEPHLLAVQVFHEYLGGRWRRHADALRVEHDGFIEWALSAEAARVVG